MRVCSVRYRRNPFYYKKRKMVTVRCSSALRNAYVADVKVGHGALQKCGNEEKTGSAVEKSVD